MQRQGIVYRRRVQFYETDAQGVVHHSNYFRYFEEARGEFLRERGMPYSKIREKGYEVVLLSATCEFKKPIVYDELMEITLSIGEVNRFIFEFSYEVKVEGDLRAVGRTKHCTVRNGRIVSLPGEFRKILKI